MVATIHMLVEKEKTKCEEKKSSCSLCVKVETGSLIFAMVNCIVTGLISMITTVLVLFFPNEFSLADQCGLGIVDACSLLGFSLGLILAKGVLERKALYVKIYFVYGVLVTVLSLGAAVAAVIFWSIYFVTDDGIYIVSPAIVICCLYSTILVMVRATYKKFAVESQYQHQMLDERRY